MFDTPEHVHEVLRFCEEVGKTAASFYLDNGADVVAVVDPMTSQISEEHFDEFVAPYLNGIFDTVRSKGGFSSIFVCGDATRNLDAMARTTCDNMSVDENIALDKLIAAARGKGKSIGGNLKLTVVLLLGTEDDSRLDAIRCMDACGTEGFILAPGCDLPYDTPAANLIAVAEMVHDDYKREVAKATLKAGVMESFEDIVLPNYSGESSVYVDVVTLNSETCAPCHYMMDAVKRAAAVVSKPIVVREHRVVSRDGIGVMCKLGVANIPTICIDGEAQFISMIPDQETLVKAIEEKITLKSGL
jgi:uroporphyrinogen decarboxylase